MVSLCIDKVTFLHIMTEKTLAKRILCYVNDSILKRANFLCIHEVTFLHNVTETNRVQRILCFVSEL